MRPSTDHRAGRSEPDAPVTRRAAREAREAEARSTRRARRNRGVVVSASTASGSRTGPGRAGRGVSVIAMFAVLGIGVATSLPAMALLTEEQVRATAVAEAFPVATARGEVQALDRVVPGEAAVVDRESLGATAVEQLAAVRSMHIANTFTNNPWGAIQWPFPVGVPITSHFGPREAPTAGASTDHLGVDFAPGEGVPIQIIADGVVREVVLGDGGGCGVNVTIDHMIGGELVSSKYCHMQRGSVRVQTGQVVTVADIVGAVGNTGVSTGAHLHFEIRLNGTAPVDPYAWLKANAS